MGLSVLRRHAGLAGCGSDGLGYILQRLVWRSSEDNCGATRPVLCADGSLELLRWGDGQDDRCAIDRRRVDSHPVDRKSVGVGPRVAVCVDLGGRRVLKKKIIIKT